MTADSGTARAPGLLFVVNSLGTGGAEKQVITLLNRLDPRAFRLHLAYLKRDARLLAELHADRLEAVICCDVQRKVDRQAVRRLRELIARRRIDAVICTNPYAMLYGHLARGAREHTALASVFHSTVLHSSKEKLQMLLYRPLFNRCDLLVYVCENQRQYWRRQGLHPPDAVVHNGIDTDFFTDHYTASQKDAMRGSLGLESDDYVVGLCSRLSPEKAPADLLRALAHLREQGLPAKALFIGDGPERSRLEQAADALDMRAHMRITGIQRDVRPYTASCDVMALVSHSETFSMAALESMALAKAMVMSATGGAGELVVPGEHGFLFAPGDIAALTTHLRALASPALRARLGAAAALRIRERFTVDAMSARFTDSIEKLLARRAPQAAASGTDAARAGF